MKQRLVESNLSCDSPWWWNIAQQQCRTELLGACWCWMETRRLARGRSLKRLVRGKHCCQNETQSFSYYSKSCSRLKWFAQLSGPRKPTERRYLNRQPPTLSLTHWSSCCKRSQHRSSRSEHVLFYLQRFSKVKTWSIDWTSLQSPANEQVPRTMTAANFGVAPWKEKFAFGASSIGEHPSMGFAATANTLSPFGGKLGPKRAARDWNSSIIYEGVRIMKLLQVRLTLTGLREIKRR